MVTGALARTAALRLPPAHVWDRAQGSAYRRSRRTRRVGEAGAKVNRNGGCVGPATLDRQVAGHGTERNNEIACLSSASDFTRILGKGASLNYRHKIVARD